ncbi:hypothetical protein KAU39_04210 [bacterium]|nr:hypothetical protein [bacterium]
MNKRAKEISKFLEKETEGIIDFYEYQKEGFDENERYESEEMEDVFIRTLIGYIEQRKKTKESGELLN